MRFDAHIIHVQIKIANLPFTNIQNPFFLVFWKSQWILIMIVSLLCYRNYNLFITSNCICVPSKQSLYSNIPPPSQTLIMILSTFMKSVNILYKWQRTCCVWSFCSWPVLLSTMPCWQVSWKTHNYVIQQSHHWVRIQRKANQYVDDRLQPAI